MLITQRFFVVVSLLFLLTCQSQVVPEATPPMGELSQKIRDFIHLPSPNHTFRIADSLKYRQEYRKALDQFIRLQNSGYDLSKIEKEYFTNQFTYLYQKTYQFEKASVLLNSIVDTLSLAPANKADYYFNKGVQLIEGGKGADGANYLLQANGLFKEIYGDGHAKSIEAYFALGNYYFKEVRLDSLGICIEEIEKVLSTNTELDYLKAKYYYLAGLGSQYDKAHEQGLRYIDLAIDQTLKGRVDSVFLIKCYAQRSQLLRKLDKREIAEQTLEIALAYGDDLKYHPPGLLDVYEQYALQSMRKKDSSYFFQAIQKIKASFNFFPNGQQHPDCLLAYYSYKRGSYGRAIGLYKQLIEKYLEEPDNQGLLDEAYYVLAEVYREHKMIDSAKYYNQLGILNLTEGRPVIRENLKNINKLRDINPAFRRALCIFLGKQYSLEYDTFVANPTQQSSLFNCVEGLLRLDSLFFESAEGVREDALLEFAEEHFTSTYNTAIHACIDAYKIVGKDYYLDKANFFIERIKYAGLARGIYRRRFRESLPDSLAQALLKLEVGIDKLCREQTEKLELSKLNLSERIFKLECERKELLTFVQDSLKDLVDDNQNIQIPALAKVQTQLNKPILQYYIDKERISCIVVREDSIIVKRWVKPMLLDSIAKEFISILSKPSNAYKKGEYYKFINYGSALYQGLLAPVISSLKNYDDFEICPDVSFPQIPYECLLTRPVKKREIGFKSLPYLILDRSVTYFHTLQLSTSDREKFQPINNPKILAYSFSDNNSINRSSLRGDLVELRGALKEINSIERLFKNNASVVLIRAGNNASLANFRDDLLKDSYDIVHLGLHALSDVKNRWGNQIFFTRGDGEEIDTLYSAELEYLPINGAMVILSACETAIGSNLKGEGIYSLARSCIVAGANSVVASLWGIPDRSSAEVVGNYYSYLSKGKETWESLHLAKLDYLDSVPDKYVAFPGFWSGLVNFTMGK